MAILKKIGIGMGAIAFAMTLAVISGAAQGRHHWAGDGHRSHGVVRSQGSYDGYGSRYDDRYRDRYDDRYYETRRSRTVVYRSHPRYTSTYYYRSYPRYSYRSYPRYYTNYPGYGSYYRSYPRYRRYPRNGLSISFGVGW